MREVITDETQITPDWLNEVLRREGVLDEETISDIQRDRLPAHNSQVWRLTLKFSSAPDEFVPQSLILKQKTHGAGAEEVLFLRALAAQHQQLPMMVRCYDAEYEAQSGASHLLLEDLTQTHITPVPAGQAMFRASLPSPVHLAQMVDCIARFHAHWWEHPVLGKEFAVWHGWMNGEAAFNAFIGKRATHWASFIRDEGHWFPDHLREVYEEVLSKLPLLWQRYFEPRYTSGRNITVINGDCYFSQFLCPKDPVRHRTHLVDFDSVCTGMGAFDLMHMFATFWTREQRQEGDREMNLLRQYHEALQTQGITTYTWDDLLLDYKASIILMIFHPVWDQTYQGSNNAYCWPKMQSLTDAYEDLGCGELLR